MQESYVKKSPVLKVLRASAGSGKTFRLTIEYLKLILQTVDAYSHILAVTFTNKATTEMKDRIICELYGLGHDCSPNVLTELQNRLPSLSSEQIKQKAQKALGLILHDYNHFRIETIDSFFQSILRNLAKELGLGIYLNIELNTDDVLKNAVDNLIEQTYDNKILLHWISNYIEERINDGKNWRVDTDIKKFGEAIFSETFQANELLLEKKLEDKEFLFKYKNILEKTKAAAIQEIQEKAEQFLDIIEREGLTVNDFAYKQKGVAGYFLKLLNNNNDFSKTDPGKYTMQAMEYADSWVNKNSSLTSQITVLAEKSLIPLLNETEEIRLRNISLINSCQLSSRQLNNVGLLSDISRQVKALNKENNRFMLADTSALLQTMIGKNDAPFIYEKIGTYLHHIMIDEFQDTSHMQWENFVPLIQESLSNGNNCLIVGDEKQSIYRWRNSDWQILSNINNEKRFSQIEEENLKTNWRSEYNIVEFNNFLFSEAIDCINNKYKEEFNTNCKELKAAYSSIKQDAHKKEKIGYTEICFPYKTESNSYEEILLENLIHKVEEIQEAGVKSEDITILTIKNSYISTIATYFNNYPQENRKINCCYDIISDEAFRLDSSLAVNTLIDGLRYLSNNEDSVYIAQLINDWNRICQQTTDFLTITHQTLPIPDVSLLKQMPLYELIEKLYQCFNLQLLPHQEGYLSYFFDQIINFIQNNNPDIDSFLKYWDQTLHEKTISSGKGLKGIRILSIHKSKGLEFHTVLIPYCNWDLNSKKGRDIWCAPQVTPFNELTLVPIRYGKDMKKSIYETEYQAETHQALIDSLNVLYVALTRAKCNLILFCEGINPQTSVKEENQDNAKLITISDLIRKILTQGNNEELRERYESLSQHYLYGKLILSKQIKEEVKQENNVFLRKGSTINIPFPSYKGNIKFRQSNQSRAFIASGETEPLVNQFIDRGKLLHEIFASIDTIEQIEPAIQQFIINGIISAEEREKYITYVKEAIQDVEMYQWYNKKNKLIKESTILYKQNSLSDIKTRRPDRIILRDNQITVLDFKFGKPQKAYINQVKLYIQLLQDMGYKNVSGYLWYVDFKQVEAI